MSLLKNVWKYIHLASQSFCCCFYFPWNAKATLRQTLHLDTIQSILKNTSPQAQFPFWALLSLSFSLLAKPLKRSLLLLLSFIPQTYASSFPARRLPQNCSPKDTNDEWSLNTRAMSQVLTIMSGPTRVDPSPFLNFLLFCTGDTTHAFPSSLVSLIGLPKGPTAWAHSLEICGPQGAAPEAIVCFPLHIFSMEFPSHGFK